MEYLIVKENPYFSMLVRDHAKSLDINDSNFCEKFNKYLVEYVNFHWAVIADYLNEKKLSKIEDFNKSFQDFQFASEYLSQCFMAHFSKEYFSDIKKMEDYFKVPNVSYTAMKDYFINDMGDKIYRKAPFSIMEDDMGMSKDGARIIFLLSYNKNFIEKMKQSYIYHSS